MRKLKDVLKRALLLFYCCFHFHPGSLWLHASTGAVCPQHSGEGLARGDTTWVSVHIAKAPFGRVSFYGFKSLKRYAIATERPTWGGGERENGGEDGR